MQIRLTVVDPLGPPAPADAQGRVASRDVLVTAPAGTALSAVASALASAVSGDGGAPLSGAVVLYAGAERLDPQRCTLGEPPLLDGAVLSVGAPAEPEPHPEVGDAPARLDVIAGPDAGGVHLLHGGQVRIGRSADADVPLDDPDVSRLHCAVTLDTEGRISVADLGSTNGTTLDGTRVGARPVRFTPGVLLRIGESTLRLAPAGGPGARMRTAPDGEGHVRVSPTPDETHARANTPADGTRHAYGPAADLEAPGERGDDGSASGGRSEGRDGEAGGSFAGAAQDGPRGGVSGGALRDGRAGTSQDMLRSGPVGEPSAGTVHDELRSNPAGTAQDNPRSDHAATAQDSRRSTPAAVPPKSRRTPPAGAPQDGRHPFPTSPAAPGGSEHGPVEAPLVPEQGGAPRIETRQDPHPDPHPRPHPGSGPAAPPGGETHAGFGVGHLDGVPADEGRRKGTPLRGMDVPQGVRRRGGLTAWARRLAGGRAEQGAAGRSGVYDAEAAAGAAGHAAGATAPETWPDPAALLLTALGPGPRLWERGPGHPEALTVRLGTADRTAPDGFGLLPAVPVTADLREAGALGLAGPRPRLAGLARAVLAQLAALHAPDALEIVLISTDRSRSIEERTAEWSWLGWLPHVRPAHGQDCRLLLAHDREQAAARTDELLRRLEDHLADRPSATRPRGTAHPAPRPADHLPERPNSTPPAGTTPATPPRRPSWARDDGPEDEEPGGGFAGPYTVVVVDGDPGGAGLRDAVTRLVVEGPRAGIHVVCLAETDPASPASPVTETYEAACAVAPAFRECGAVALLSGDVATALRLLRVARAGTAQGDRPGPVGHGTVAAVDAVSPAWAERFARALAPLRTDAAVDGRHARVSAPLPQGARLLDELGLARATPASLMARWADAADDTEALGGRACAVLGAGPRGPVGVDLVAEGPHLLVEGPPGSGRTELLRAIVASLAAAERPDRLSVVLMDGRDGVSTGRGPGDGLRVCMDIPHVTTHLLANDPVRMREFAQSLSAELKRRGELLGRSDFAEWHTGRVVSGRMVAQRSASTAGAGDLDTPPSATLRLRPAARREAEATPPLPRLVVVVDDLDALVSPPLGSPGRPAAGSVMRALEAVAREGERLGVHLVAAAGPGGRTAETEPARRASLRVALDAPTAGPDEPAPGRGRLTRPDGRVTPFQGGRVTGRIPRTATLRPTVVPLEWQRMGDPPTRRPVRELGNGPTDLALLASALERAAREVAAPEVPSLL